MRTVEISNKWNDNGIENGAESKIQHIYIALVQRITYTQCLRRVVIQWVRKQTNESREKNQVIFMNVNNMSVLLLFLWYFYEGFYVLDGYLR